MPRSSAFHIIQEVVLNQSRRPPGFRSQLKAFALRLSSRMPPWPWTMAFGGPVVPDEKSTNSGWSKATGSNSSGPGSASSSSQASASGTACSPYGTCTTWRRVGRAARIVATSSRRSTERSRKPYPPTVSSTEGSSCVRRSTTLRDAELGRAARPDRAETRSRRECHQRLGDVRQVGDDAVARADAEPHEAGPRARHLLAEVRERELDRLARLRVRDDRDLLRRPRRGPSGARRSSAARRGTTSRRASSSEARTVLYGACAFTSKNSQIDDQNPARSSTDQRHSSS